MQGFPSKIRSPEQGMLGDTEKSQQAKQAELQKSIIDLGIAWSLALVCCTHHLGHWLHSLGLHQVAHLPILNTMHQTFSNPAASAALGAVALLGPGRKLLVDGALSLARYVAPPPPPHLPPQLSCMYHTHSMNRAVYCNASKRHEYCIACMNMEGYCHH